MKTKMILSAVWMAVLSVSLVIPVEGTGDKVELRLHLEKGEVYGLRMTVNTIVSQVVERQKISQVRMVQAGLRFEVDEANENSPAIVKAIYQSLLVKHISPWGEVQYDSTRPVMPVPSGLDDYAALAGKSITVAVSPSGSIKMVKDVEPWAEELGGHDDSGEVTIKRILAMMAGMLGRNPLSDWTGVLFGAYPAEPVVLGETWRKMFPLPNGFIPVNLQAGFSLAALDGEMARLESHSSVRLTRRGRVTSSPGVSHPSQTGIPRIVEYELEGRLDASIQVRRADGWPIDASFSLRLTGTTTRLGVSWPVCLECGVLIEPMDISPQCGSAEPAQRPDSHDSEQTGT